MKDIYSGFTVKKNRLYNTCDVKMRKFSKILSQKCAFFPWGNVKMHKLIEYQIENVMKFDLLVFGNIKKCCAS